jgi:hypothetical protein
VTAGTSTVTLQTIKNAIKNFEAVQNKFRSFGANDTEPDSVFQGILWAVINDEDTSIPMSGDGWELYSSSMDCKEAADALHLAAVGAVQQIFGCPPALRKEMRKYIKDYCWRYN